MEDGDQNFFPVYEPDADALKKKWLEAEEEARAHHYDSTKEGESSQSRAVAIKVEQSPFTMATEWRLLYNQRNADPSPSEGSRAIPVLARRNQTCRTNGSSSIRA